jgi:flagellin
MGSLSLNSNVAAARATRRLAETDSKLNSALQRLSTGMRINRASDDPAGLAVASSLEARGKLYTQADRNIRDALSAVETLESALSEQGTILNRLAELAEQAANGSLSETQRASLNAEYAQLLSEFGRTAAATNFNSLSLALGSRGGASAVNFQVGVDGRSTSGLSLALTDTGSVSGTLGRGQILSATGGDDAEFLNFAAAQPSRAEILSRHSFVHSVSLEGGAGPREMFLVFFDDLDSNMLFARGLVKMDGQDAYELALFDSNKVSTDLMQLTYSSTTGEITSASAVESYVITGQDTGYSDSVLNVDYRGLRVSSSQSSVIDFTGLESAARAEIALDVSLARIQELSSYRGQLGALGSRLQSTLAVTAAARENSNAALGRIRDADVATELSRLTAQQILRQTAAAVLGQGNQQPALAISLLR